MQAGQLIQLAANAATALSTHVGPALDTLEEALDTLDDTLDAQSQAVEAILKAIELSLSPAGEDLRAAEEALAALDALVRLDAAEGHEETGEEAGEETGEETRDESGEEAGEEAGGEPQAQGEAAPADDPDAQVVADSLAAATSGAQEAIAALRSGLQHMASFAAPHAEAVAAMSTGLKSLVDKHSSALEELNEEGVTAIGLAKEPMDELDTALTTLITDAGALLTALAEQHDIRGNELERVWGDACQAILLRGEGTTGKLASAFGELGQDLIATGAQITSTLERLDSEATRTLNVLDGDIGTVKRQVEQIATLLDRIKPLLQAAEALL